MSYNEFKQTFWSAHIQTELEKMCVLEEDCNKEFEGEVKYGSRVKILGVERPTIFDYTGDEIGAPEADKSNAQFLDINQAKAFNFKLDDIDKAQSKPGLMEALTSEASLALAEERDSYIAKTIALSNTLRSSSLKCETSAKCKTAIDSAFVELWKNGVKINGDVTIAISPVFYNLFKDKLTELYTDNVDLIKKGIVGMYNGAKVKLTNNLYNDGTDDYIIIRTKKAVAFAGQINDLEPYRPEKLFADALKGLDTFGCKVVRGKEVYVVKAHL